MHAGLLHALHHPRVDVLLEFGERPFAVEFHIRPRLLQRLPRRAFEPLQGFGRNPVHLIAETRRNHLRVFGHLVALAVRNFLGRVVDLRAAVLHVGPAVMVQLRRQQTRNLRRAIAQRRARLLHHLLERRLHGGLRFFLIPVRSLQQRVVRRMLRFGGPLLEFLFNFRYRRPARLLHLARDLGRFGTQPRQRILHHLLGSLLRALANRVLQLVGAVGRDLDLFQHFVLQLRHRHRRLLDLLAHPPLHLLHLFRRVRNSALHILLHVRQLVRGLLDLLVNV